MKGLSIEIYSDNNPQAARSLRLGLCNGKLNMTEQDYGPLVEKCFGDSDLERFLYDIPADAVKRVLGIGSDAELIEKLKAMFGGNSGFELFKDFLRKNRIYHSCGMY